MGASITSGGASRPKVQAERRPPSVTLGKGESAVRAAPHRWQQWMWQGKTPPGARPNRSLIGAARVGKRVRVLERNAAITCLDE